MGGEKSELYIIWHSTSNEQVTIRSTLKLLHLYIIDYVWVFYLYAFSGNLPIIMKLQ